MQRYSGKSMPGWLNSAFACLQKLASVPQENQDDAQRRVKSRTLGNIRLIAALFNKGVVSEKIVVLCVEELIGDPKAEPHEDNIEVCTHQANCHKGIMPAGEFLDKKLVRLASSDLGHIDSLSTRYWASLRFRHCNNLLVRQDQIMSSACHGGSSL